MLQIAKIRRALSKSEKGLCGGTLLNHRQLHCVMGELLFQIGYSNAQLHQLGAGLEPPPFWDGGLKRHVPDKASREYKALQDLEREYGITAEDVGELIMLNDGLRLTGTMAEQDAERLFIVEDMLFNAEEVFGG